MFVFGCLCLVEDALSKNVPLQYLCSLASSFKAVLSSGRSLSSVEVGAREHSGKKVADMHTQKGILMEVVS